MNESSSAVGERVAHVVVASTEADMRAELEKALQPLGTVERLADPSELVGVVRARSADLVVLDARADTDGALEALAALRAEPRTRAVAVLLLCAPGVMLHTRIQETEAETTELWIGPFAGAELLARARMQLRCARRRAALEASEADLRATFEAASLGIVHVDPQTGVILRANHRYGELLGRDTKDLVGTSYLALISPSERADGAITFEKIRESRGGMRTRRKIRRPDGTFVTIAGTSDVIRDAEGRPLRIVAFIEDLSERDRLETELRASEDRYRDLVEQATAAVFQLDAEGHIAELNGAGASLFGAVLGASLSAIADDDTARSARELGARETRRRSVTMRRHDGTTFAAELILRRREDGLVSGIARNTTEEDHARREATLLVTVAEPVLVVNDAGMIEYANAAAHRIFGYDPGELLGLSHDVLVPDGARARHAGHVARFRDAPVTRPMAHRAGVELLGRRRDGSQFPIEVSLNPVATAKGPMVSTVVRDVTERREIERAARAQSDRLAAAIDAIPDIFSIWDSDERLVMFNAAFARICAELGIEITSGATHEALERRAQSAGASSARALFSALGSEDARTVTGSTQDVYLGDGRIVRVSVRTTSEGSRVMIGFDLTRELRRERELEEARRGAEAANHAKTEFLASMSHELRTPLNAVLGFAQLLGRDTRAPLTPRQREMVERILRGGEHLLRLVDDVLDLARIEARGVVVDTARIVLARVVGDVLETLAPMAREAGITLHSSVPQEPVHTIVVDRVRFAQILMNFGSNAIKYNRRGGSVTFEVALAPSAVRVVVSDTGLGVPVAERDNLFLPFHRAGQETGSIPGTGIGLAISRRLAETMHGSVGYRNRPEGGSEFWVEIPGRVEEGARETPSSPQTVDHSSTDAMGDGLRILYIDDNAASLELVAQALSSREVELVTAPTAEVGLDLARARRPDLIFMDINLPGRDGFEALAELRKIESTRTVPVVALSAAASPADRQRGLAAGFARYLTKPIRLDEVDAAIVALAHRKP